MTPLKSNLTFEYGTCSKGHNNKYPKTQKRTIYIQAKTQQHTHTNKKLYSHTHTDTHTHTHTQPHTHTLPHKLNIQMMIDNRCKIWVFLLKMYTYNTQDSN